MCEDHEGPCKSELVLYGNGLAAVGFQLIGGPEPGDTPTLSIRQSGQEHVLTPDSTIIDAFMDYLKSDPSSREAEPIARAVRTQLSSALTALARAQMSTTLDAPDDRSAIE